MPVIKQNLKNPNPQSQWLLEHTRTIVSQHGEEGVLEKIFEVIGAANKWCVEFGAWDGIYLSNTYYFINEKGWSSVLIEADPERFAELTENFKGNNRVFPVKTFIGYDIGVDTIDDVLKTTDIPKDFDLISIDIDGNDYHIWDSIKQHRPRVVIIEFNRSVPNDIVFIQDRDHNIAQGASLAAMIELGREKGYELVSVIGGNGVFVVEEEFSKFGIQDNSIDAMFVDRYFSGRLFQGYDGTLFNTGLSDLSWKGIGYVLKPDSLQVVPMRNRSARSAWVSSYLTGAKNETTITGKVEFLNRGLQEFPGNFAICLQLAKYYLASKKFEECEKICRELIEKDSLDDEAHLVLSRALLNLKDVQGAHQFARQAYENRTRHTNLIIANVTNFIRHYYNVLIRLKDYDTAYSVLDGLSAEISEDSVNFGAVLALKADLYMKTEKYDRALETAERAVGFPGVSNRPNELAAKIMCLASLKAGKFDRIDRDVGVYIELANADPKAMLQIAKAAKEQSKHELATRLRDAAATKQ